MTRLLALIFAPSPDTGFCWNECLYCAFEAGYCPEINIDQLPRTRGDAL